MRLAIKILIVNQFGGIVGGRETYLRAVISLLRTAGHDLYLAVEHKPDDGQLLLGERDKLCHLPTQFDRALNLNPEVVFMNGLFDHAMEGQLAERFPTLYFPHGYYGTCVSGYKRHSWPRQQPCNRSFGLSCLAYYFPRRCGGLNPWTMVKDYQSNRRQLSALRKCTILQVASEAMRDEYLRHGFSNDRVFLNPLFPANAQPDQYSPARRPMTGLILLAGRLTALKGGDFLIRALHLARQARVNHPLNLAVAGDGPEFGKLKSLATTLGIPATFHGWVEGSKLEELIRGADLLAMPSLWPEPFGLLGIEAGCHGVPSVGFAHGGITDWLKDGQSGMLAPSPPTVEGLANAIVRAIGNADQHHQLRVGAWEISKIFNAEAHIRRLVEVLHAAAASRS